MDYATKLDNSSPESCLGFSDVPLNQEENLLWRAWLWEACRVDRDVRSLVIRSCKNDIRFYHASFCWTFNTRLENPIVPYIPYDYQSLLSLLIVYNARESMKPENKYRRFDLGVDKSRDMGITWAVMLTMDWLWRFERDRSFRCISRIADFVDNKDDDDALFQKLDFNESRLPSWLSVRGDEHDHRHGRPEMKVINKKRNNTIRGEASSENAGRGGRNLIAFRDEEAFQSNGDKITKALNQTTRFQLRVTTPNGIGNSIHLAKVKGGIDWMTLHWSIHPDKSEGLYSIEGGKVKIIDEKWHKEYERSHGEPYGFMTTPTHADPGAPWEFLRSPWFDGEDAAADSVLDIAQEIQIAYLGSGSPYFRAEKLALLKQKHGRKPDVTGRLEEIVDIDAFLPTDQFGNPLRYNDRDLRNDTLKLWFTPDAQGRPYQGTTYSIALDIANGNGGGSDSVASIADDRTNEKIAEYRSNGVTPEDLAKVAIVLIQWFTTPEGVPFTGWDMGGPGGPFSTSLMHYANEMNLPIEVYYFQASDEKAANESRKPGVPSNKDLKKRFFANYREALFYGSFITPSIEAYEQAEQFVHDGKGGIAHQRSQTTQDKSETGDQHGDVTTSEVILVEVLRKRPQPIPVVREIEPGTLAYRMQEFSKKADSEERWFR